MEQPDIRMMRRSASTPLMPSTLLPARSLHAQTVHLSTKKNDWKNILQPAVAGVSFILMAAVALFAFGGGSSNSNNNSCMYNANERQLVCDKKPLKQFPTDFSGVLSLRVGSDPGTVRNSFTVLTKSNFTHFPDLHELRLLHCGVEEIQPNTFSSLHYLRRIDLRFNRLVAITEGMFQGLSSLDCIDLSHNRIHSLYDFSFRSLRIEKLIVANNPQLTSVAGKAFAGAIIRSLTLKGVNVSTVRRDTLRYIVDSLQELDISDNLQPLILSDDAFLGLNLRRLTLDNDSLTQVTFLEHVLAKNISIQNNLIEDMYFAPTEKLRNTEVLFFESNVMRTISKRHFSMFTNLKRLHMRDNELHTLDASDFEGLRNLKLLDVSENHLSYLTGDFNEYFPSLTHFYLRSNLIRTLPPEMEALFIRLRNVTVSDSPLHCNCEWLWFARWLRTHGDVITDARAITCATPSRRNFTQMPEYAFQCRSPVIVNATVAGSTLVCTAEGDPRPDITWKSSDKQTIPVARSRQERHFETVSDLKEVTPGANYTCIALNIAGEERLVVSTDTMSQENNIILKDQKEKQEKVKILESPTGFFVTLILLALLAYLLKQ